MDWTTYVPWALAALSLLVNIWLALANVRRGRIDSRISDHETRLNHHTEVLGLLREAVGELRGRALVGKLTDAEESTRPTIVVASSPQG